MLTRLRLTTHAQIELVINGSGVILAQFGRATQK